ncbi:uncharacterized protein LOC144783953 [Lissotriton helveticus]
MWDTFKAGVRGETMSFVLSRQKREKLKAEEMLKSLLRVEEELALAVRQQSPLDHIMLRVITLRTEAVEGIAKKTTEKYLAKKESAYELSERVGHILAVWTRQRGVASDIKEIIDTQGNTTREPDQIREVFRQLYSDLYAADNTRSVVDVEGYLSEVVPSKLSLDDKAQLEDIFQLEEFVTALGSLPSGKAAGPDQIPLEFFNHIEPRGKQNTGTESAGEPPVTQSSSTEDPAAVPSAEPLPSTSADGDSGAASAIPAGTGGTEAPTPAAVGGEPTAAGDVTPSQKPTRKELAVRARQRKLQAIVEAYRRLVDQAEEEEEEEAAAAAAASSNAPGPKPAGLRRRGQAAARRRIVTSSAAPPQQQQQQHACKCRCRDFKAKILRRVAKLEEERKKLEDGLEERVKILVDKHLKARRL